MRSKGTYALILEAAGGSIEVGRLGRLQLRPGFYVYVGSAFGPGGIQARLAHHCRPAPRPHWHIDYLSAAAALREVWCTTDPIRREHQWAAVLAGVPTASIPQSGFGASDCLCRSHLFFFSPKNRPAIAEFQKEILARHPAHAKITVFGSFAQSRKEREVKIERGLSARTGTHSVNP